jgi:hypothetical protein
VDDWAADSRDVIRLTGPDGPGTDELAAGLPPIAAEVTAVRDLDLVDPDRWPQALELLTRPPLRAALTEPTRVRLPDGTRADVPSYTAWWLRRHAIFGGRHPSGLRLPDSDPLLAGLYDMIDTANNTEYRARDDTRDAAADSVLLARLLSDPAVARALGVRSSLGELLAEPGGADDLLTLLADPLRPVSRPQLRALWSALATCDALTPDAVTPPDRVRAVRGRAVTVADADDALVLDAPDLWPLLEDRPLILAPYRHAPRLADLLDLPLASQEVPGAVDSPGDGDVYPVGADITAVLSGAPASYVEHDALTVDGTDVPWRYVDGVLHTATVEGIAHGLAWAAGQWHARHLVAALLSYPEETPRLLAESDLDS